MSKVLNTLSSDQCWKMVNRIDLAPNAAEMRKRCIVAESWLVGNCIIDDEDFDQLMSAVAYLYRESYHRN